MSSKMRPHYKVNPFNAAVLTIGQPVRFETFFGQLVTAKVIGYDNRGDGEIYYHVAWQTSETNTRHSQSVHASKLRVISLGDFMYQVYFRVKPLNTLRAVLAQRAEAAAEFAATITPEEFKECWC